jgi:hypothetical protein
MAASARSASSICLETVVDLGPVDLEGILVLPRIVDDREFRTLAGARRGDAVVLIENGQPQIVMRQGASASALREELTHLAQSSCYSGSTTPTPPTSTRSAPSRMGSGGLPWNASKVSRSASG